MKIFLLILLIIFVLFLAFQIYTFMATKKSETQPYTVIKNEDQFEIRHYPTAIMAKISTTSKSYRDLGSSGFGKLANYIFGGNSDKKQISMTSPVHMDIGDTVSTMAFVMPSNFTKEDLPTPNNSEVKIQISEPENVAVLKFDGFASTSKINEQKAKLEQLLKEKGISYYGNFRYLGYNPPYQVLGRRNEVIVSINTNQDN
ncbi:MAG TPA: heme-binding protein [Saprospiraceae bacterium]|nr:heme-binding protein [Saprospiraceae bacterium]HPN69133.1 heme-binding protein [Saprospiraceae bacterium]